MMKSKYERMVVRNILRFQHQNTININFVLLLDNINNVIFVVIAIPYAIVDI